MANVAVTNTFVAGTSAVASQVNTNFSDITTWLNNRNAGTDTWGYMKVTATVGNPIVITSSASTTEVSIDNTATDGDPLLTFKLSGSTLYTIGSDDSDSDFLKFATSALTTNVAFQIPSSGAQVQFAVGSAASPSISFIGDIDSGLYWIGANQIGISVGGSLKFAIASDINAYQTFTPDTDLGRDLGRSNVRWSSVYAGVFSVGDGSAASPSVNFTADPDTGLYRGGTNILSVALGGSEIIEFQSTKFIPVSDNAITNGDATHRWSDLRSVKINGADICFQNGYILREYPCTENDVNTKDVAWFKENANQGIQILNDLGDRIAVIARDGTFYAKSFKSLQELPNG